MYSFRGKIRIGLDGVTFLTFISVFFLGDSSGRFANGINVLFPNDSYRVGLNE
jgi:hypothetical protein